MNILRAVLFILITLLSFNLLKIFVFSQIKINKWLVFSGILILVGLSLYLKLPIFVLYIVQLVYVILILWFMELFIEERREKRKNKNKKVIQNRPKPKENRMK